MSALKKQRPSPIYSPSTTGKTSEKVVSLRDIKMQAERLRETLQKSIIDNPQASRKAAMIISLWIEGKSKKKK
jgi:hypothetical protein